jgi:2-keto-3-deoxy-L-rhamnonate aldolase RhmA
MTVCGEDMFQDAAGGSRVVRGVAITTGSARLAEMAARLGFEAVWIEMEHGAVDFAQVEQICMAVEAGGGIPAVRVPDGERHHVLRALESGARVVVVPMINTAEAATRVVEYGKFPPLGSRGFNLRSRGLRYGLSGREQSFAEANEQTHLFAQIETCEAVDNLDAICRVPGLSGVLLGPGDLSSSLGRPGEFNSPELIRIVTSSIQRARALGRNAGIFVGPGPMLDAALVAGCNLAFLSTDVAGLVESWSRLLAAVKPAPPSRSARTERPATPPAEVAH